MQRSRSLASYHPSNPKPGLPGTRGPIRELMKALAHLTDTSG
jgi:hypothetical protein